MAVMYPSQISNHTKSGGEYEIFRRLRDDPLTKDWFVLHSLDIASHRSQVFGEVDFVVIVPEKGVLFLEVKGAKIVRRENGLWYYGYSGRPDRRGPFKQVSEAMHSIRQRVVKKQPELSRVVFWTAVVFPYVRFVDSSPEWHSWQLIDYKNFSSKSMGENVLFILGQARKYLSSNPNAKWFSPSSQHPTTQECKSITNILRPDFEYFESPESRRNRRNDELLQYTQEQFDALDAMDRNPRVIFSGPAGTGKTLLAVEAARRNVEKGNKTLLICYNRLLGNWLQKQTASLGEDLTVNTLHGYMTSIVGKPHQEEIGSDYWEIKLPAAAVNELLMDTSDSHQRDVVVIDEAQDLLAESYLDFFDLCLKGGMGSGKWMMFGDFEKQSIYEKAENVSKILNERFKNIPRYSLRNNCRNTPRIAEYVRLFGGLTPDYSRIRRPDNFVSPKIIVYKSMASQSKKLMEVLAENKKEGYSPNEIVVLSSRSDTDCLVANLPSKWRNGFISLKSDESAEKVRYGTIHSYKGLEAPIIILTDVDKVKDEIGKALFYIGVTRALDKLYVLASTNARQEMLEALSPTTNATE